MRALTHPAPNVTEIADRPDPVVGPHQLLVAVRAAGLNRADLLQAAGKYPAPAGWPADIPGLEYAGEVMALGDGVTHWRIGDRVMGLVGGGAHAERVVVHEREAMAMPVGMSFADAAAIPEAFLTAWDALVLRARVLRGDRVLFHAIGSGVGTAACQLARTLALDLIGTSRTQDKLDRCMPLGLARGILTTQADWSAQVGGSVPVIIDTLGAQVFAMHQELLAPRGRLVLVGTMTGGMANAFDMSRVLRNRQEIIGTAMRSRALEERIELITRFSAEVLPHFLDGTLRPVVDRVLPMTEFKAAHEALASNRTFGKVVFSW